MNVIATQIAISNSGRMMFIGTSTGSIRSIKYPFGDVLDFQEHQAHSTAITRLKISCDDQYLFSTSEDGCIYMFRLSDKEDRTMKKERIPFFADEV